MTLPLFIRKLICLWKGHRRGVPVDEPPFGKRVFRCPRCERRTRYAKPTVAQVVA
jgi:hypothetical protein